MLAVYNPASRSRTTQVADMRRDAAAPPATPVVVGRDVGREGERLEVTTLGALDAATIDMRCLLIVGPRGTTVTDAGRVWTKRFVPEE